MYFWLNFCDGNHIERISIAVENIDHLFHLACQVMDANVLYVFLLSEDTWIDEDEYLSSLKAGAELIVCIWEHIEKLLIYFE